MVINNNKNKDDSLSIYDNMSADKKVGFIEDGHKYILIDDPTFTWRSVTGLLKDYKKEFDAETEAKRLVLDEKNGLYYGRDWEEVVAYWKKLGEAASSDGTLLHAYGESLLNRVKDIDTSELEVREHLKDKMIHTKEAVDEIYNRGYELAKTEALLYDTNIKLAGQSDIILKKDTGELVHFTESPKYNLMIYDWKFLKKKLATKSFWKRGIGYTLMSGPFRYLHDCNWIHYSIQLAIYQTLTGVPEKVIEKVLIVVTDKGYEFIPAYPMRVYWDIKGNLQAVYQIYNGTWYVSEDQKLYKEKPVWLKGL